MAAADVCLCVAERSLYHTRAKGEAQAAGTRGCFNAPASLSSWTGGAMTADFREIRAVAERLADRLRAAQRVHVTSPAGTDVSVSIGGREPRGWYTGIVERPGEISAFPGGEVSFPPLEGSAQGAIVFERVMSDLGRLAQPIRVAVEDGKAVSFAGGEEAERLRQLVEGVPGGTNIAELGIGLNSAARVGEDITEAKKRLGTAHFALGGNAGGYGGVVECPGCSWMSPSRSTTRMSSAMGSLCCDGAGRRPVRTGAAADPTTRRVGDARIRPARSAGLGADRGLSRPRR
jgi:leucyl aminopeptidase (aminopeptidase T)